MYRKRLGYFSLLTVTFLLLSFLLSSASEANYLKMAEGDSAQGTVGSLTSASYRKVAENDQLALYVNPASLSVRVLNKRTGKVWSSSLEEKDENLNQIWLYFFQSGVTVEYMDDKQKMRQASIVGDKADVILNEAPDGFTADINFQKLGFRLTLQVALQGDHLTYHIPFSSIEETNPKNQIEAIYVFPFLGATKGLRKNGSIFIPDGSGALIDLGTQTIATQPYIGRVYGEDWGMKGINLAPSNEFSLARGTEKIYLPVYGISDGETKNGMVTLLTKGAPYAEIRAYPSGVTTVYNWATVRWIYRETYFKPVDKKGNGITVNQKDKNRYDASAEIFFLDGENYDYVGMAKRVQKELIRNGVLVKKETGKEELPIHLEFIGAENKEELLAKKVIPMTTLSEMDAILQDLRREGAKELSVVLNGWMKGGMTNSIPTLFSLEKALGSEAEWRSLIQKYASYGTPLRFGVEYTMGMNGRGYGEKDLIQAITEQLLVYRDGTGSLRQEATKRLFSQEIPKFKQFGIDHLAVNSLGNLPSSFGDPITPRDKALEIYQSIFAENDQMKFSFYAPNDYLWKYADEILEIPMESSNFILESESVPFLQIVLKGYIDYYAPPSNFEADPRKALLERIDYGAFPSFYLTEKDPIELLDTGSDWFYTSQYKVWKEEILYEYGQVQKALLPVKDATFVSRKEVGKGVYQNSYSNGISIFINYTKKDYKVGPHVVPAESFLVIGG